MSKIKIFLELKNEKDSEIKRQEYFGLLVDNKIVFYEDKVCVTIFLFDNKIDMNRVSSEYELKMPFLNSSETIGIYHINDLNMDIKVDIITRNINMLEKGFIINYESKLEEDEWKEFYFKIEYEAI